MGARMKKLVGLFALLLVVPAATTFGDLGNGIDLTWDECVGGLAALNDKTFTCDGSASTVPYMLIGCYKIATDMPDFFAMEISIDLQQANGDPLVPFYHFEAGPPPGCNNNALTVNDARTQTGTSYCARFSTAWGPTGTEPAFTGIRSYAPNYNGQNGHGRLLISIGRASNNPVPLVAHANYYAFHLEFFDFNASQSGGGCTGCGTSASIVWNSATLIGNTETRILTGPNKNPFFCALINQGYSACFIDPIRNTTWGQLKSIYR